MVELEGELRSVRSRLTRLQDIFNSLGGAPPGPEAWPFWLEKLNALGAQLTGLGRELQQHGVLEGVVVEPQAWREGAPEPLESIANTLLRTKLAPEVEAELGWGLGPGGEGGVGRAPDQAPDAESQKRHVSTCRGLKERLEAVHEELRTRIAEDASAMLAGELGAGPRTEEGAEHVRDARESTALLEATLRFLHTGHQ